MKTYVTIDGIDDKKFDTVEDAVFYIKEQELETTEEIDIYSEDGTFLEYQTIESKNDYSFVMYGIFIINDNGQQEWYGNTETQYNTEEETREIIGNLPQGEYIISKIQQDVYTYYEYTDIDTIFVTK